MLGYYGLGSCQSAVLSFGADDRVSGYIFSNVKRGRFWSKIPTMNILHPLCPGAVSPIWLQAAVWRGRLGQKGGSLVVLVSQVFSFGSGKMDTMVILCSNLPSNSGGGTHWRKHDAQVKAAIPQLTLARTWSNTNSYHSKNYLEGTLAPSIGESECLLCYSSSLSKISW